MFASGNPALSPEKFGSNPYGVNYADLDRREAKLRQMTLQGTINNTALSLGVVVVTAGLTWTMLSGGLWIAALVIGALAGLVLSLIIAMKPTTAPFLTLPYAAAEGAFVGGLSAIIATRVGAIGASASGAPPIADAAIIVQAVLLTFGIFAATLLAYSFRVIRASPALMKFVSVGSIGMLIFIGLSWATSMLGAPGLFAGAFTGWGGIAFFGLMLVIATLSLVGDFAIIEQGVQSGAPKHMEWYGAFALTLSLVWIYTTILRLLAIIRELQR